jgi:putative spermidine/putrescine transport system permease protein
MRRVRERIGWVVLGLVVVIEVGMLLGPTVVTVIVSFGKSPIVQFFPAAFSLHWYELVATSAQWTFPAVTSLVAASLVMIVGVSLGTGAAFTVVRSGVRFRSSVASLLLLPLITPSMLLSLGLALVMTGLRLSGTMQGLVLAQGVIAIPYVIVNLSISLRSVDRNLESAARSLGAGPFRSLLLITVPVIRRGLVAGALFAFLASWDDAIVALFLNGPRLTTLPVFLLSQASQNPTPAIAAAAGYLSAIALLGFAVVVSLGVGGPRVSRPRAAAGDGGG